MPNSSMKVKSSNIADVSYDAQSNTMSVTFRDGSTYNYFDVPQEAYMRFMDAASKGSYFASYIKNNFSHTKIA